MSTTTRPAATDADPTDAAALADAEPATALPAPRALLLDFGGVVVTTTPRAGWARELAAEVVRRAEAMGLAAEQGEVEASLRAGRTALSLWKNASSRRPEPRELTAREIVAEMLLADLPDALRHGLALEAGELLAAMAPIVADHHVRPGIPALLEAAREHGVRLAIVSNAHSGRAHRAILAEAGLADAFAVQIYSDEVGIRKPHPGMLHLAAEALGVHPEQAWYVGDTYDRDVAAGRRAGIGALVITRDHRTDHPPFAVTDRPDLELDSPEELLAPMLRALRRAADGGSASAAPSGSAAPSAGAPSAPAPAPGRPALLLDHGGVITLSTPAPDRFPRMGERIAALAAQVGVPLEPAAATAAVEAGWDRHRARKHERDADGDGTHAEIPAAELWGDLVGQDLPAALRPALRLEAAELSLALHRAKSEPALRPGALELIAWARDHGIVVGIVSNTISGRGVREILERHGVAGMIGPAAYSDEVGVRKPGRAIFEAALAGLETLPADVVYVGDKAVNDGRGGTEAGIGTVCLLRGGKDEEPALARALADGHADHVLDSPAQVIDVLAARLALTTATATAP